MEQDIPQESLIVRLSQQMTTEFDKILLDSRGIKRTITKLEQSDVTTFPTQPPSYRKTNKKSRNGWRRL
jgi:hypothetical protein